MLKSKRNVYLIGSALMLALTSSAYAMNATTEVNGTVSREISTYQPDIKLMVEKVDDNVKKVTLSLDQAPSTGYKIHIDGIQFGQTNQAYLLYSLEQPKPGDMNAQVITQPKAFTYVPANYEVTAVEGQSMIDILSEGPSIRGTIKEFTKEQPKASNGTTVDPNTPVSNNDQATVPANGTQNGTTESTGPAKAEKTGGFHVEGSKESKLPYDKAKVSFNESTKFFKKKNGKLQPAAAADLTVGAQIDAYFVGPVLYMYPVSATAGIVIILDPAQQQETEAKSTVSPK